MIIREKEPANLEMPFGELEGFFTPNEQFYIRSHFPVPEVDLATWRLQLEGAVSAAREWSLDDLRQLPATTVPATLECAGNGRVFLVPKVKGTQWELGAVGNAEWTGVSLGEVLRAAGVNDGRDRGHPGRGGQGQDQRSAETGGRNSLRAQRSAGQSARGRPPRLRDERRAAHAGARFSAARDRAGLVRDGGGEMAATHHRHRPPFNGYYQTVDYAFWQRDEAGVRAGPDHGDAGESLHRAPGD